MRTNKYFFMFLLTLIVLSNVEADDVIKLSKYQFYNAIYMQNVELVKKHLEAGYDPNKCRGEAGWVDSNPLRVLTESLYTYRDDPELSIGRIVELDHKNKDKPRADIEIFDSLIEKGADVHRLPYVWLRINRFNNKDFKMAEEMRLYRKITIAKEDIDYQDSCWVEDVNYLLEALLKAGADPNMKGHPFPFGKSRELLFFSDKKAFKYFNSNEATTPINEAIKKGKKWESQVDLLLKYGAVVDEDSVKAAEAAGDDEMIKKIKDAWNLQNQDKSNVHKVIQ